MAEREALHWFLRQRIKPPGELCAELNLEIQKWPGDAQPEAMDQRELWELGQRISAAFDELLSAIREVFDDIGRFDEDCLDRAQPQLDRAALALVDVLPQFGPTEDLFWSAWIKPPDFGDLLVEAISTIDGAAKYLVKEMGLSRAAGQ